jgi:hypothetical protein
VAAAAGGPLATFNDLVNCIVITLAEPEFEWVGVEAFETKMGLETPSKVAVSDWTLAWVSTAAESPESTGWEP